MAKPTLFERMSAIAKTGVDPLTGQKPMELFTVIDDGQAIVRKPKGIFVQAKLYQRGGKIFVGAAGGFIRVTDKFGDTYGTSHPDYKVLELAGTGVKLEANKAPRYSAGWGH